MNWLLRKQGDGRQHGPLDDDALRRWAWDGCVQSSDELSNDDGRNWVRAEDLEWLRPFMVAGEPAIAPYDATSTFLIDHPRSRSKGRSLLDLTPMVDCVFLLLLFFFVTATFAESESSQASSSPTAEESVELDVSVPEVADQPTNQLEAHSEIYIVVSADGSLVFDGTHHTLGSLRGIIRDRLRSGGDLTVIVLAEPDVQYRHVAATVAAIEGAGVSRVLLGAAGNSE